jgi:hypothetical protein
MLYFLGEGFFFKGGYIYKGVFFMNNKKKLGINLSFKNILGA